ncbi:MAG: esterase-like activity of phytase family protein [Novosphingobium sp.]|nr:esterase-like activity of phytase family protein [Novosphingobium sp.]
MREAPARHEDVLDLQIVRLSVPPREEYAEHLGPFELEAIWQIASFLSTFGGFSALLPPESGEINAISDKGWQLRFTPSGSPDGEPLFRKIYPAKPSPPFVNDIEAATSDPISGNVWLINEGRPAFARFGPGMQLEASVMPEAMKSWNGNFAAEAVTRLSDGRFVVLREAFTGWFENIEHDALIFDSDPVEWAKGKPFKVRGPVGFSPTEMVQLPDGRLLVLMRRMVWPHPARFAGRIAIGDPQQIEEGQIWQLEEAAWLTSTLPIDNFEGMAIELRPDGRLNVWLISDDNGSVVQRTLLWKLSVDPADLPGTQSEAQQNTAPLSDGPD